MGDRPLCILKDCVESFSEDGLLDPVPGAVHTVAELVGHLWAAAAGPPRQFNLELSGGVRVVLHLGGPWAAVRLCHLCYDRHGPPPGHPPDWRARAERPPPGPGVSFQLSGREADLQPEWLLPADEVIRMAAYLAEYRALPPWGVWVENHGNRYAGGLVGPGAGDGGVPF